MYMYNLIHNWLYIIYFILFFQDDMPLIRRWWCALILDNFTLQMYVAVGMLTSVLNSTSLGV